MTQKISLAARIRTVTLGVLLAMLALASSASAVEDKRQFVASDVSGALRLFSPTGTPLRTLAQDGVSLAPTFSPDGTTIAFDVAGAIRTVPSSGARAATTLVAAPSGGFVGSPVFSPVKEEIAFWERIGEVGTLWAIKPDGSGRRVIAGPFLPISPGVASAAGYQRLTWSPDGKTIAFVMGGSIVSVPSSGGGSPATLVTPPPGETVGDPAFSPDGTRIAFVRFLSTGQGPKRLVTRDLTVGAERSVAEFTDGNTTIDSSPSWSADSDRIAMAEFRVAEQLGRVITRKADGSGSPQTIVPDSRNAVFGIAWDNAPRQPNYYIKHIEIAQALSPIERFADLGDPMQAGPYTPTWKVPDVAGYRIPLIADRQTAIRVYVGDASLPAGATASRTLHLRIAVGGTTLLDVNAAVQVSAVDRAPDQRDPNDGVAIWVPASQTTGTAPVSVEAEINGGQVTPECAGCFPNGNLAVLSGVSFEPGGELTLAPVSVSFKDASGKLVKPVRSYSGVWRAVDEYLPVGDGYVRMAPSPLPGGSIEIGLAELALRDQTLGRLTSKARCAYILTELFKVRRTWPDPPTVRWVGTGSPGSYLGCFGYSMMPGSTIVLLQPEPDTLAHELGHTLGLDHTLSLPGGPAGAEALPYVGIGALGYQTSGKIRDPLITSDLMGYTQRLGTADPHDTWTSPATWNRMHTAIVGRVARLARAGASTAGSRPAPAAAPRLARRRLVSGFVAPNGGAIFSSQMAKATADDDHGPIAGRVVALDRHGSRIASAAITGRPIDDGDGRAILPFVVALPPTATAASLQLRTRHGKKLATLRRSRHLPAGRFVRLVRRTRRARPLTVRWRASDADHDRVSVLLQARRGTAWRTVARGTARSSARLAPASFGRANTLRLRLLISDDFNTRSVTARPLRLARR